MRKDVRFGLAIGGVLLAVIVVYTLSVRKKPVQTAVEPTPAVEQTATTDNPPTPVEETHEQPQSGTQVASAQQPDPFATTVAPHDAGSAGPAVSATPNDPRSVTDWNQLLATGQRPPTVTSTPTSEAPAAQVNHTDAQAAASTTGGSTTGVSEGTSATTGGEGPGSAAANTPAASTPAANGASGQGSRTYKVQKGDTLSSIAKAEYGSANFYPHILRANPGLDPQRLRPGMTINLPDRQQVLPHGSTQASEGPASLGANNPSTGSGQAAVDASRQYRVQAGDSLYKISVKLYGNGGHVDKIYEKNKQLIGADPARLKTGMVLELPEAPTVAQAR